ncbi:hypothetical protein GCM10009096_03100 [Parasphingorhabdus litoris]|uniref:Uncharacterized protein n=1 Tax=Parasphingorhabdus litoris TaxID=394733 RepID=A0ABP3JWB1_9SPHN|nr:hypothetical protein [Parasphingorhabdus litoris]
MRPISYLFTGFLLALTAFFPAFSQSDTNADPLQYADIADLSVSAPLIAHVTIKEAIKVDPKRVTNAPPGTQRYYIVATTNALIRGQGGIPETIRYIIDLPLNERGRAPKIKKKQFIIFARNLTGSSGDIQLAAPDAQIDWTPARDQRVRSLVREIVARNAAPAIARVGSAFHVPGTIIGEGETQIFLETNSGDPVSITILSREGQKKVWAVSLSEIVDEAARAPVRNSLLWYRLACFLPKSLPEESLAGDSAANANQARRDYDLVIQDLGNCPRTRPAQYRVR